MKVTGKRVKMGCYHWNGQEQHFNPEMKIDVRISKDQSMWS